MRILMIYWGLIMLLMPKGAITASSPGYVVSFYPEGGALLYKTSCLVAFKAVGLDGLDELVVGNIVDQDGNVKQKVETTYSGLGYFYLYPNEGEIYFLECENREGVKGRFALPIPVIDRFCVRLLREKDRLLVSVSKSGDRVLPDSLFLQVLSGDTLIYGQRWDKTESYVVFDMKNYPVGMSCFLLQDERGEVISSRVFLNVPDKEGVSSLPPDFRISILPLLNHSELSRSDKAKILDIKALTLWIEQTPVMSEPDMDIWKNVDLGEVVIRGLKRDHIRRGVYASAISSSRTINREEIEQWHVPNMLILLQRFGGVSVVGKRIYIRSRGAISFQDDNYMPPLVIIDDIPYAYYDIDLYPVNDVEEIFILKGADAAQFGSKAKNGIIVITTKRGKFIKGGIGGK